MALNQEDKKKIIQKINKISNLALSVVIVEFKKISVNTINKLRKEAFNNNVFINITRNTLLKLAFQNTEFECLNAVLQGSILIAFSMKHPGTAVRILKKYEELSNNNFKIIHASFEGKLLSKEEIIQLALMPTYEESIMRFMFTIQEASIGKFVRILHAIYHQKKIVAI
ncbi:50S ribosomal protein L10 [Buchnera aphidicola (Thelaxes californica)]|uniref:Large ribosomal subunit protein uL10 n=1 Tax=Buchnera aphidicola (Thelaxes californica) TaxID=1315998 RepID=A0A4D6YKY8_9GAMM|nr:50S ribosomal protein L10 [Buchnera aphidicola]QCI26590.1 50S ribosomal protein L10 [Buchnera aphidicola (Thelaxes californica)]